MVTKTIDVPLPPELEPYLQEAVCIPLPKPAKVEINLPMGGMLKGLTDVTKGVPDDCSLSFSLALQLGPFLANLDCLMKIIKVLDPMIKAVTALAKADVVEVGKAAAKLAEAVPPLVACMTKFFGPLGVPVFVRDLLCLVIKILRCVTSQLKSIMTVMGGLSVQIKSAEAAGNGELLAALRCGQENAQQSAQHMMTAIEPVMALISIAQPLLDMAGVNPIQMPQFASPEDVEKMQMVVDTLDELVKSLELAANLVGGC